MTIRIEEAAVLVALAEQGSFAKAASVLGKRHTVLIYMMREFEEKCGLKLLDRSGYRTELTAAGKSVLLKCKSLLDAEQQLSILCRELKSGWEPSLKIIYDNIISSQPILSAVQKMMRQSIPTHVQIFSEFLKGVEEMFVRSEAQFMFSLLPPQSPGLSVVRLPSLRALLVANRNHPLVQSRKKKTMSELSAHLLLTVRGSDIGLNLSTSCLEQNAVFQLSDFSAKKSAILTGIGFGWMPELMIENELKSGKLKTISWEKSHEHTFHPHLYHRKLEKLGKAGRIFLHQVLESIYSLQSSRS